MRHYRRRPKRIKFGTLVVLLLLVAVFLASCAAGSSSLWVRGFLGISFTDYDSEAVLDSLAVDGEECARFSSSVGVLLGSKAELEPFAGSAKAVRLYRDEILSAMLRQHYSLYTANETLCRAATKVYPERRLVTIIPKADLEAFVFRNFGGNRVTHEGTALFEYLPRADVYTTPAQLPPVRAVMSVKTLVRTEHTYRMQFSLSAPGERANSYTAIFLMRGDGGAYLYSVSKSI